MRGSPLVTVPVLSSTATDAFASTSIASADFISIPRDAPRPIPHIIAVGVASPREHGQLITRTDIARESAKLTAFAEAP